MQSRKKVVPAKARMTAPSKSKSPLNLEEEEVLRRAQIYLLIEAKRPMLWTVADIREDTTHDGSRRWIVAVNLRYPTGFEGYLGDLLVDGDRITELTDLKTMQERARQIAADPEGRRQWDEFQVALASEPIINS